MKDVAKREIGTEGYGEEIYFDTRKETQGGRRRKKEGDAHLPLSQAKCLNPLKEWKANGRARMPFAAYFTDSGSFLTVSTTFFELNVSGATR